MNKKRDPMEQIFLEDMLMDAEDLDREIELAGVEDMPEGLEDIIKERIDAKIAERERERIYAQLSEEDKKALELGRKMLKESEEENTEKVIRRRRGRKVYAAVVLVALLVLAMGITSIGGAERVIEMVRMMIGDREIVKINTEEDNYIVTSDKEEDAYQEIKDVFGIDPVKPSHWPEGTVFLNAEIDKHLQTATLLYDCKGNTVQYAMSSHYTESSWGIDVEDELVETYMMKVCGNEIVIKGYETKESKIRRYSAEFEYKGLNYFFIGTIEKLEFEKILNNLKFL